MNGFRSAGNEIKCDYHGNNQEKTSYWHGWSSDSLETVVSKHENANEISMVWSNK